MLSAGGGGGGGGGSGSSGGSGVRGGSGAGAIASRLAWELATVQTGLVSAAASVRVRLNHWLDMHLSLDDARAHACIAIQPYQVYYAHFQRRVRFEP